ncbi:MAG: DUF1957 domain-containing protein [Chloracidobacterium sp.]|nr:DUF1957 domain-containing protein [Chloracidobacterium sp.]
MERPFLPAMLRRVSRSGPPRSVIRATICTASFTAISVGDAPLEYLKPHLHEDGSRRHLGLKYYRITGRDVPQNRKQPYIPSLARDKAAENASHFIGERIKQAKLLRETFEGHPPLVVSPYDAELYGHWWFEGPQFIDFFFKKIHFDQNEIECITPGDFLDSGLPIQVQQPTASSWGENGYYKVWINEANAWMYPYQHDAERRMTEFANKFAGNADALVGMDAASAASGAHAGGTGVAGEGARVPANRILNQMARELLLAQSSDWAFQIYQGTTVEYSTRRFRSHIQRFDLLAEMLDRNTDGGDASVNERAGVVQPRTHFRRPRPSHRDRIPRQYFRRDRLPRLLQLVLCLLCDLSVFA